MKCNSLPIPSLLILYMLFPGWIYAQSMVPLQWKAQFPQLNASDTLKIGIETQADSPHVFVSTTDLLTVLGPDCIDRINWAFDQEVTVIKAIGQIPLDQHIQGYIIRMEDNWWVHSGMIIARRDSIYAIEPIAQLDGGDGGQELMESWLLFDKSPRLSGWIQRGFSHYLEPNTEDGENGRLIVHDVQKVSRYDWLGTAFAEIAVKDTAAIIEQFPIDW